MYEYHRRQNEINTSTKRKWLNRDFPPVCEKVIFWILEWIQLLVILEWISHDPKYQWWKEDDEIWELIEFDSIIDKSSSSMIWLSGLQIQITRWIYLIIINSCSSKKRPHFLICHTWDVQKSPAIKRTYTTERRVKESALSLNNVMCRTYHLATRKWLIQRSYKRLHW